MPIGVVIGVISALFTAVVTEIYCHRYLAHRAFTMRPIPARLLDTYFRVIVGTDPESWAAVHRLHHRHADTALDPHSPVLRRPLAIVFGTPYLFAVAKRRLPKNRPAGLQIWALRSLVVVFYLVLFGPVQVLTMLGVHLFCYMGLGGLINTVGHLHGSKPHPEFPGFDLPLLSIPLLGHGYHNSHHAHPAAARTGRLDPIWPLLRLGAAMGQLDLDGQRARWSRARPTCCAASISLAGAPVTGADGLLRSEVRRIEDGEDQVPRRQPVLTPPLRSDGTLVRRTAHAIGEPLGQRVPVRRRPPAVGLEPHVGVADGIRRVRGDHRGPVPQPPSVEDARLTATGCSESSSNWVRYSSA